MPPVKDRRLEPSFRVSRQIATLFTAWLGCLVIAKGVLTSFYSGGLSQLLVRALKRPSYLDQPTTTP